MINSELRQIKKVLTHLKIRTKLAGILLSYADGRILIDLMNDCSDIKTFSAMCATTIKSAKDIQLSLGNLIVKKVSIEIDQNSLIILEIDKKFFITLLFGLDSKVNLVFESLDEHIPDIVKRLGSFC